MATIFKLGKFEALESSVTQDFVSTIPFDIFMISFCLWGIFGNITKLKHVIKFSNNFLFVSNRGCLIIIYSMLYDNQSFELRFFLKNGTVLGIIVPAISCSF